MIRLHQSVALMALCLTVVAAGLILESPATTFVAIGDAVTAASIQRASFSSAAVPSPGSKDEIETTSTKVKIAAIDSSSDNEGYRVSSHLSPISTVAATNTRIVKTDPSWIGKTNEKIIPVTSSTSSAVAVNWPTQSVPVVNLKPNLESILSEMPLASTEIVNKLVATAATSISSLQSISISTEPWKIAPSSLRNTMQTFTGDWKKSSITNARSLPGFDNYASTKASISSGVAGTRSMANYIEETIGNYQVPNAVGRFGLGGLEKVSSAGSEANLYGEPVSSGINEFIGPENSAKPEERKNGGLKVANVGHTSAIESNNEQEEYKEQYARTEMQPLIMTAVGLLVKTETEKVKRGEEEKEDARGEKAADCISNWQSISTREELNKAPSRSTGLEVESRTLSAAPLLFKLATTKGQLLRRRERRLSFNATSFAPTKESPQLRLPLDAEIEETTADPTKSHEGILDRLGITPEHLDIGFSTFQPRSSSSNVSIGRERSQQSPARNESEDWTKVIAPVDQWPVKHSAVVEGELVLGGLMMVHEREDSVTCGPVMPQGGIQALEAMLYTLDRLNQRGIVPGVKVGAHILDDCDKDTYGLEMAVDFIKGSISNIDGAEYHCNKTAVRKVISGVVGAASSVTSIQVANLLRLFRIPQVSFFSTSPELSNKQRFEYFTRTIPSDHYQVKAMVEIIKQMNWTYVSVIYEESNYGVKAFEELESLLAKNGICIAIKEKLVKDSGVADESVYDSIVQKLLTKRRARGCIIYGSDQEVAGLMKAVRRVNATGAFSWIGSDGWSARGLVSDGNEAEVEGTLSVQPQANPVEGFEEYFLNLTVENNKRNPWFVEFWEDHFKCRYPNSSLTPYNSKYENFCTTKERLNKGDMAFENQLQFVSDAVMAFAYAFRDMHNDLCHGKVGLCDEMKPTKGEELLKYLRKVDFKGLSSDRFKFDNNGDGPARYNIIHFKQTSAGQYKWIRVGQYLEGVLHLNMTEVQFRLEHAPPPESVCSLPCELGQAKKYVEGESCCWHCFNCTQYQIRKPDDETQCIDCPEGTVPDDTHSFCRDIPEEFLKLESGWAIGAMSFSSTGILVTFFVVGVFLKHNDTPVVRASGRELSYILLTGILLCYLVTFALVLRPTDIVCGIQRFAAGFCFTVVYAALLTKTNRISRIFRAGKHSAKRPSFISPRSQLIICSMLVFVQILINGVWMIIDPAKAMHHYPTREDNLLVCNSYIDASYMIAFTYPIILIIICTVYAVLTRKIPEAFNESKHIGFTMYTTCVIWLAFVPLYFGTGNHVALRITSMSVTISLSASVTIACLFSPKLYIILIRPERNVRQSMMPNRHSTTKSSAVTGTNASSMMAPITLTAVTCDQNKAVQKHVTTTMDCSTQSEYYEMAVRESQNGKPKAPLVSTATQTNNNNNKTDSLSSKETCANETSENTGKLLNNSKVGNGPLNQNDVSL